MTRQTKKQVENRLHAWLRMGNTLELRRVVIAFAVSILAVIWAAIGYEIANDRADARAEWAHNLENLTRAFEEHTVRTVSSVDEVVKFVRGQYLRQGDKLDLAGMVSRGEISSAIYNQIGVIDQNGTYILSSLPLKKMFLGDRPHFRVHAEAHEDKAYISQPVLGRASGRWSIQLTRRIADADGGFGGVVVASLDPEYFGALYSEVDLGAHGLVTLVGDDGIVRARRAEGKFTLGQDVSASALFTRHGREASGTYIDNSRVDGVMRLYAFRRLQGYPLTVATAITLDHLYERSNERRNGYLIVGGFASGLIILFTPLILRLLRRQAEHVAQLQASRAEAESANKMKSEFLASMSHELRTPLNGILGFSDLMRNVCPDEESRGYSETIYNSGSHLLSVLNLILDIAKIEAGKMEVNLAEEHLASFVGETAEIHRVTAENKGLELLIEVAPGAPETIICDPVLLRQVLNNLLSNAIKFTSSGSVTLRVENAGSASVTTLSFAVTDTGIGIPPESVDLVFEKFSQVDQSVTRVHEGTGLGLALVRQLVELMGGQVAVTSVLGKGSTFSFTLPIALSLTEIKARQEHIPL
jgi:signal transduction histidine kinase